MEKMYMVMKPRDRNGNVIYVNVVGPDLVSDTYPVYVTDKNEVVKAVKNGWVVFSMDDGMRRVKSMTAEYEEVLG